MAELIKMDTEKLNSDMNSVDEHLENIRGHLKDLKDYAVLLDGMWTGLGSDAFRAAFHADLISLDTVIGNLESISKFEHKAYAKFQRCGINVRSAIDEVRV